MSEIDLLEPTETDSAAPNKAEELNDLLKAADELIGEMNHEISEPDITITAEMISPDMNQAAPRSSVNTVIAVIVASGITAAVALIVSVASIFLSLAKTDLTIGQGELYIESGSVNRKLENLLRDDLAKQTTSLRIRNITITIQLNGNDMEVYQRVSDIGAGDSVSAHIEFHPQAGLSQFAGDCRTVLDVMAEQGVTYDDIIFTAESNFIRMRAEINGRFDMDITENELMNITYYFGDIDLGQDIPDITI